MALDEYWIDFPSWLPDWPTAISLGLVLFLLSYLGIACFYLGMRKFLRAHHSEAVLGLFTFFLIGYAVLTVIGIYFSRAEHGPRAPILEKYQVGWDYEES